MSAMAHLLTAGDYVKVAPSASSNGGVGWVVGLNDNSCDVEYVVGPRKNLSREVTPSRVTVEALGTSKRVTSTDNNDIRLPSLLSPAYAKAKKVADCANNNSNKENRKPPKNRQKRIDDLIKQHPTAIHQYLLNQNKRRERGWLRVVDV